MHLMIVIKSNLICKVMNSIITMNKDTINLINHSASTFLNIAQMTQYLQERYAEDEATMSIEEAREMTLQAVRDEYAKS